MRETGFGYHPKNSFLHTFDARFKAIIMAIISIISTRAETISLLFLIFLFFIIIAYVRLPLKNALKDLKFVFLFLIFAFIARVAMAEEGIFYGALDGIKIVLRFIVIISAGFLFIATTKTFEIKAAIEWFLSFIPFVPAKKISTMIGLLIRFMPVIIDCAKEINMAQKARGGGKIKNPVYRLRRLVIPIMLKTVKTADNLVFAMKSRGYNENRTGIKFFATSSDKIGFAIVFVICCIFLYLC